MPWSCLICKGWHQEAAVVACPNELNALKLQIDELNKEMKRVIDAGLDKLEESNRLADVLKNALEAITDMAESGTSISVTAHSAIKETEPLKRANETHFTADELQKLKDSPFKAPTEKRKCGRCAEAGNTVMVEPGAVCPECLDF